jgi:hypothetical protein
MANQLSINDLNAVREEQRELIITYAVALSGNYTQFVANTNVGEVLTPNTATSKFFLPRQYWGQNGPRVMYLLNTGSTGYAMSLVPGADNLHWLLVIFSNITTQLAAGAYPAGLAADAFIQVEGRGRVVD